MATPESLNACLEALETQQEGTEVLVAAATPTPDELKRRFAWARFIERPGQIVPELWRDGIDEARGDVVALTISPMVPAPDWVARLREAHRDHDAVGGAIDPGERLRLSDWAEYFCRYAREMRPFSARASHDLAADNAGYKREQLQRFRASWSDGFWEPEFHRCLKDEGIVLWHTPEVVVFQGRSAGAVSFTRQRLVHGWKYGHQRGAQFGFARNLAGVVGAPLVPLVMTSRIFREVSARGGRHRRQLLASLPFILWFNVVWAAAEAAGHLDSLRS